MKVSRFKLVALAALGLVSLSAVAGASLDVISKLEVTEGKSTVTLVKYWKERGVVCQQYVKAVESIVSDTGVDTVTQVGEVCDRPTLIGQGVVYVSPAKLISLEVVKVADGEIHIPVLRKE